MWRERTCRRRIPTVAERTAAGPDRPDGVVSAQSNPANSDGVQRLALLRAAPVALSLSAAAVVAVFIAWAPWAVGFGVAIAGAIGWCSWLQRHPD